MLIRIHLQQWIDGRQQYRSHITISNIFENIFKNVQNIQSPVKQISVNSVYFSLNGKLRIYNAKQQYSGERKYFHFV